MIKRFLAWYYIYTKKNYISIEVKKEIYEYYINKFSENSEDSYWKTSGICGRILGGYSIIPNIAEKCYSNRKMYKYFPEIYVQKPKFVNLNGFWWSPRLEKPRIDALNNALRLLEKYK